MTSPKFQTRILHFDLLGKTFSQEFIKTLFFLQTVEIKIVISLLFSLFIFTEKSTIHRKAYKKFDCGTGQGCL